MRRLLYRLRAPLIVPSLRGGVWSAWRLRVLDALLDVLDMPDVWRMERAHRARMRSLDSIARRLGQ